MAQKHGKKYLEVAKLVDPAKLYTPDEAIALAKRATYVNFDSTVELHLRMGVDPRYQDQVVRGVALLPNGLGKQIRVLVFAQGDGERIATEAGADLIGNDELIKRIEGGWFDFDVAIATPDMMGKVGRLGRYLGRRNLMPNPRSGTIVPPADLPRAIREARLGRVEFKLDKTSLIHVPIGKVSFEESDLHENLQSLVDAIVKAKPSGAKGQYIRAITMTTTMGPGISLDLPSTLALSR